jgi:hypothetical protein
MVSSGGGAGHTIREADLPSMRANGLSKMPKVLEVGPGSRLCLKIGQMYTLHQLSFGIRSFRDLSIIATSHKAT